MSTGEPRADDGPHRGRVLVVAPYRRDAALTRETLERFGIAAAACGDPDDLARELLSDGAALVMTQEALTPRVFEVVANYLAAQPSWSELPLILLLDRDRQKRDVLTGLRARFGTAKLTVLQRPVRALELATTVQSAIAARRRQLQLRDHIAWQEELQRELNHRVKNMLANVMAIYYMSLRQSTSLADFAASFEGRLTALSGVHNALVDSVKPRTLTEIAEVVLAPYCSDSAERVGIAGPHVELTAESAVTIALCLHELATNAAKYGALSGPGGKMSLTWSMEMNEQREEIRLSWTETGGPVIAPPSRRGYGTGFIRSAIRSLGGAADFEFAPEGLVCTMTILAERVAANAGAGDTTSSPAASG